MIRIVGFQRSECAEGEFLLLQNQGSLRAPLRGHAVAAEEAYEGIPWTECVHLFHDDVNIAPGKFVLLRTCEGIPRWSQSKDGNPVYIAFMNRAETVWSRSRGPLHVLARQHRFATSGRVEPNIEQPAQNLPAGIR